MLSGVLVLSTPCAHAGSGHPPASQVAFILDLSLGTLPRKLALSLLSLKDEDGGERGLFDHWG